MDNTLIPIEQYPDQTLRMDLDGKPTTIRLYWSDFDESLSALAADDGWVPEGCWNMDISNDEFEVAGIVITGGCDILEPHAQASLGGLFLVPTKPEPEELTFESFGIGHLLLYGPIVKYDEFVKGVGYAR